MTCTIEKFSWLILFRGIPPITVPLDEATQSRSCDTQFHTGDVWKTVLCLKHYRPDLDIFTIATPWTGLTVVTGLDPASRVLSERYEQAVARFVVTPFSAIEGRLNDALNVVPNGLEHRPVAPKETANPMMWDFPQSRKTV
jgi:hypothetical protein